METIAAILPYLIGAVIIAVLGVLFAGILSMGREVSNRLMRWRVGLQALAVGLMLLFWLTVQV